MICFPLVNNGTSSETLSMKSEYVVHFYFTSVFTCHRCNANLSRSRWQSHLTSCQQATTSL